MTRKKFIKQARAIWHRWNKDTRGNFKRDLPLGEFIARRLRRAKVHGYAAEIEISRMWFLPYLRQDENI